MTKARIIADYAGTGATTDLATQAELDAVSTVASAALPKAGGTMTGDLVPATPMSHRNMIINGGMQVWQRATDITASDQSNEGYNSVDRWYYNFNSACPGTLDIDRSTDTPDGFGYSMKLKCNATGTPVSSTSDFVTANMRVEAQDLQHLNYGSSSAKTTTLSWYMKSVNYTDPLTFSIQKPDGTAAYYLKSFTPTTSWARYSMTIPANTNAGHTIANDNGVGFVIQITLSGSDGGSFERTGASSTWDTTYKEYINDIGNFFASTSNELYITGVQLELGSNATPFEHRSYGEELEKCKRYYQQSWDGDSPNQNSNYVSITPPGSLTGNVFIWDCPYQKEPRTTPTVTLYSPSNGASGEWRCDANDTSYTVNAEGPWKKHCRCTVSSPNAGRSKFHYKIESEL